MSQRETKTVETKGGHKVVYKSWISGGESNQLSAVWLEDSRVNMTEDGKTKIEGFSGSVGFKAEKKLIEILVVSVNGSTENIVQAVEDLPLPDYKEILAALDIVTGKKK